MSNPRICDQPIAIIGMACRLPGGDDVDQFWQLLQSGGCAVGELPPDRLDRDLYYHPDRGVLGKSYSSLGALTSARPFDRAACPLPDELFETADIAHLTMCEVAMAACRNARLNPLNLPLRNTAVYIGHTGGSTLAGQIGYARGVRETVEFLREVESFRRLTSTQQREVMQRVVAEALRENVPSDGRKPPNVAPAAAASLVSRAMKLTGPSMVLDAACASSLQAVLLAARALQRGRIDMAIVGGASYCKVDSLILFSHAQSISGTGTRPFDAAADGLIAAEGYVAVVLKTLERALADGDPIQAVIRSMGTSCDGRGKSLWAPRKEGQIEAIHRAYGGGVDCRRVQYIEAHATSTQVGDATEMSALAEALRGRLPAGRRIPIGSVKSNIGHTLETAGMAGLLKTVLSMRNCVIPPSVNCRTLNPEINWDDFPFFVATKALPWEEHRDGHPRRAGVNSFGIGGLNVHVVLDEFLPPAPTAVFLSSGQVSEGRQPAVPRAEASDDAVAILGFGCVLPGARTIHALWELLSSGRDAKRLLPEGRWRALLEPDAETGRGVPGGRPLGGFITDFAYDWKRHKVPPKQIANANPLQFMLLDAADQALQDAGYDQKPLDRKRVGVVVGTIFGDEFSHQLNMGLRLPEFQRTLARVLREQGVPETLIEQTAAGFAQVLLRNMPALLDETGSFTSSTLASRITKSFDLMGGALALDAGSTSSLAALAASVDLLLTGTCDMMICAAGQRNMGLVTHEAAAAAGLLTLDTEVRSPFDAESRGCVLGEGVGVLLLKRLSDAQRDGDRIRGIIRGIAAAGGERHHEVVREAIRRALAAARVAPDQVALVETSGIGHPKIDEDEVQAIRETYGALQRRRPVLLGSLVGQMGHMGGASGAASLIKASLALEQMQMPACVGMQQPLAALAEPGSPVRGAAAPSPIVSTSPEGRVFAGVTSAGGDQAYHVVIERASPVAVEAPPLAPAAPARSLAVGAAAPDWRIVRFEAAGLGELLAQLPTTPEECAMLLERPSSFLSASAKWRLAVVADTPEALAEKLRLAAARLGQPDGPALLEQQGIFSRNGQAKPPKVAFFFPGQGSQYVGMLRELVGQCPEAAAAMAHVDTVMASLGYPSFAQIAWESGEQLGADVWHTQVAMLLADTILHRTLVARQIQPALVSGHSYGELAALVAAEAWTLEEAIQATAHRCNAIRASASSRGMMASTNAPEEVVEKAIQSTRGDVYISHRNAPDQVVVAGRAEAMAAFLERMKYSGFETRALAVPCPFHTPLMAEAQGPFLRGLESVSLRSPRVLFLSSVHGQIESDPQQIRRCLVAQLTTPVNYVQLVQTAVQLGVTALVEVGPQQVLTRLNRRILAGADVGIVASDHPKRPGVEQLYRVQAMLECHGVTLGSSHPERLVLSVEAMPSATTAAPSRAASEPAASAAAIRHFDATERRREKMRRMAADVASARAASQGPDSPSHAHTLSYSNSPASAPERDVAAAAAGSLRGSDSLVAAVLPEHGKALHVATATFEPPPVEAPLEATGVAPNGHAAGLVVRKPLPAPDLGTFLISFVVEQTGYPPDVVELDADLEADLGIDSIKKAQLFGELREYFDIEPSADLTLDDFPTLRHVLDFLQSVPGKGDWLEPAKGALPGNAGDVEIQQQAAPGEVALAFDRKTQSRGGPSNGHAAGLVVRKPLPAPDLGTFLVNFVVEQTGYPPDVVDLDADLEADLGIDSIKKAQLFGELREYFDIEPSADLTLDDFPTLRHVQDFLQAAPGKGDWLAPAEENLASDEDLTAKRQATVLPVNADDGAERSNGHGAELVVRKPLPTPDLGTFLVNFVVEQTGYPPDVVDLDADLEADLGIDSIKKAQLFGELREYFDIEPSADLTLDDFPTLRHVQDFLQAASKPADPVSTPVLVEVAPAEATRAAAVVSRYEPPIEEGVRRATTGMQGKVEVDGLQILHLSGAPYEMGLCHGRELREHIRAILKRTADQPASGLANLPHLLAILKRPEIYFGPREMEELEGIADGAQVPLGNIIAHNLALYPDQLAGCAQLAVTARKNGAAGMIHAVNEDSPLALSLPDCLVRIVQMRCPEDGIPHVAFSIAGQLGGINGISASGLAVSSTLLLDRVRASDCTAGRIHTAMVKAVLETARDLDDALQMVRGARRFGAWSMCLSHYPTDRLGYLEYDGDRLQVEEAPDLVMTTNHCRLLESTVAVPKHSLHRLARLEQLWQLHAPEGFTASHAQAALRDRFDLVRGRETPYSTMNTICRVDNQVSVVLRPSQGECWATAGPMSNGSADHFHRLPIAELLDGRDRGPDAAAGGVPEECVAPALRAPMQPTAAPPSQHEEAPAAPASDMPPVVTRLVLRMLDAPAPEAPSTAKSYGPAVVLGDNPAARALEQKLAQRGIKALVLDAAGDTSAILAMLEDAWRAQPLPHLFLMTPHDADAAGCGDAAHWDLRRDRGVVLPLLVCQRWIGLLAEASLASQGTLVAATALGGDFGISGRVHSVEGGALSGLLKSLYVESYSQKWDRVRYKVLDFPGGEDPRAVAAAILAELDSDEPDIEVGFVGGNRQVVRAVPQAAPQPVTNAPTPGGTWVVTGGARGVTALVALALGRRFGLNLHLLGSSPAPQIDPAWRALSETGLQDLKAAVMRQARSEGRSPADAWAGMEKSLEIDRSLQACAAAGVRATYHRCDVAHWQDLQQVLDRIRRSAGPIEGVLHGAAATKDAWFLRKTPENVRRTLAAKVDGAAALMALTRDDPLKFFIGFGSVSGRFGAKGQADYCAANEMLCKLIDRFRTNRPQCAAVGIHWHAWDEVGMAVRPELKAMFASMNLRIMPPHEGIARLLDELAAGLPEREVVFTDEAHYRETYPLEVLASEEEIAAAAARATARSAASAVAHMPSNAPVAPAPHHSTPIASPSAPATVSGTHDVHAAAWEHSSDRLPAMPAKRRQAPLIDAVLEHRPGEELLARIDLDPSRDIFLKHHRVQNKPWLPAVIGVEALAQAASLLDGGEVVALKDVEFPVGMAFADGQPQTARVAAKVTGEGVRCSLRAEALPRVEAPAGVERLVAGGIVELVPERPPISLPFPGEPPLGWYPMEYPNDRAVFHGPPMRRLYHMFCQHNGGWGHIVAPTREELAGDRGGEGWLFCPAVFDACLVACSIYTFCMFERRMEIPYGMRSLRIVRPPRPWEECVVRFYLRDQDATHTYFDFNLFGDDGGVLLTCEGYRCVLLAGGSR